MKYQEGVKIKCSVVSDLMCHKQRHIQSEYLGAKRGAIRCFNCQKYGYMISGCRIAEFLSFAASTRPRRKTRYTEL